MYIFLWPGLASSRRRPLSSNVMPHRTAITRTGHTLWQTVSAHAKQDPGFGGGRRKLLRVRASAISNPREPGHGTARGQSSRTYGQAGQSTSRTEPNGQGRTCRAATLAAQRLRALAKLKVRAASAHRASRSEPLVQGRSPQRRSTAPALPAAETGCVPWQARRNYQTPSSRSAGVRHNPSLNTGPTTAGQLGPAWGTRYIFPARAKPSCRSGPVSSTLCRTEQPSCELTMRSAEQCQRTQDKMRVLVAAIGSWCASEQARYLTHENQKTKLHAPDAPEPMVKLRSARHERIRIAKDRLATSQLWPRSDCELWPC